MGNGAISFEFRKPSKMRLFFIVLLGAHGLIHLIGFFKSQGFLESEQLAFDIPQSRGILWLAGGVLFLLTVPMYLVGYRYWWLSGILAVIVSQGLIITQWKDAGFGTVANLIILIGCLIGGSYWQLDWSSEKEAARQFLNPTEMASSTDLHIDDMPPLLGQWVSRSGVLNLPQIKSVKLEQKGKMRLKAGAKWTSFKAKQWFSLYPPGFLWIAQVGNPQSFMQFLGKDALNNGKGTMTIKLWGLLPIVQARGRDIDQGSMIRYLAESIWFPSHMMSRSCTWTSIDSNHVQVHFKAGDQTANGVFGFDESGELVSFSSMRYYDATDRLERWVANIDPTSYQDFDGVRIPTKASITWELTNGDFHWLDVEIMTAVFNFS